MMILYSEGVEGPPHVLLVDGTAELEILQVDQIVQQLHRLAGFYRRLIGNLALEADRRTE